MVCWADWGLEPEQGARLFTAAAAFYRAALWDTELGDVRFRGASPSGELWHFNLLGHVGSMPALVVRPEGDLFTLHFSPIDDIAPWVRAEIDVAGWQIAVLSDVDNTIHFWKRAPLDPTPSPHRLFGSNVSTQRRRTRHP